jgi:predicted transcriptional regulator
MNSKLVQVKDAMTTDSYHFTDGMVTVAEGIKLAKTHHVSALIINKRHENDEYGLVLLSDIAKQVIAKDRSPERVNLYEIMAKPLLSVSPDMDVRYCARLFENFGINTAPVIKDQQILGLVNYTNMVLTLLGED